MSHAVSQTRDEISLEQERDVVVVLWPMFSAYSRLDSYALDTPPLSLQYYCRTAMKVYTISNPWALASNKQKR